jgi:hypothetical protein
MKMWYSSFDNGPIGEDEDEAREAVIEYMAVEDYLAFFLDDSDLMEKVIRWCFNNGNFCLEFENELGDIEEQFFKEYAYYEEEDEENVEN